jgi:type II secretion system protein J
VIAPTRSFGAAGSSQRLLCVSGFTLAELLVSVGVLVLLVLLTTQLLNSAATITTLGHKRMDADSQARQVLDRMTIDFTQMVKRSDVDYFAKGTAAPNSVGGTMDGNDQIAFYSAVPGYYPSTGSQSPVSLVAYRVKSQNKLERLGKGLVWNGVSSTDTPVVFLPLLISNTWSYATNQAPDPSSASAYETMGPQVFRFEYFYLLKNGTFSAIPWNTTTHNSVAGMQDVSAIVVDIAVIPSKSKVLLADADIATFATPGAANFLANYALGMVPGQLRAQWQSTLDGITTLPRPAISGIRLYERFFYLSPPTLLTP